MAFTVPASGPTYAEADDLYTEVVGVSAGATEAATPAAKGITRALCKVYGDIQTQLQAQGYAEADIDAAIGGLYKAAVLYAAARYFLRDKIDLDASFWTVCKEYSSNLDAILAGTALLLSPSGVPYTRTATGGLQALHTSRNGTAGRLHSHHIDSFYGQFHGRPSVAEAAAGFTYGNGRSGGDT